MSGNDAHRAPFGVHFEDISHALKRRRNLQLGVRTNEGSPDSLVTRREARIKGSVKPYIMEFIKDREKIIDGAKKALKTSLIGINLGALHVALDCLRELHLTEAEVKIILSELNDLHTSLTNERIECTHVDALYAWVFGLNIKNGWTLEVVPSWLNIHTWALHGAKYMYAHK